MANTQKTQSTCKCRRFEKVFEIIEKYNADPAKLIPILQEVQREYRYLPEQVLSYVANSLGLSPARVYGVASFYANFALEPKGRFVVHICDGTACHVKGSGRIKDALYEELKLTDDKTTTNDMLVTVETVSCLGACGLAPVITINDEVHGQVTPEKAIELVKGIVEREQSND
jgi:NADH-quinone oxidoreductase subunit E